MKLISTVLAVATVATLIVPVFAQTPAMKPMAKKPMMGKKMMSKKPMMGKKMMSKKPMMGKKGMMGKKPMMKKM
jgi:hypothetical protein